MDIKNKEVYLTKMSKTFFDKAWFICHLPEEINTIVDFGCADGSFMKFIQNNCPAFKFVGIDNSKYFKQRTIENGFECYENLNNVQVNSDNTCLILSSVLHEIYSYANINELWEGIKKLNPKYIAIRDMLGIYNGFFIKAEGILFDKLFKEKFYQQYIDFKKVWGEFDNEKNIIHFLLKYIYNNENWDREVKENYLPIDRHDIYNKINQLNYTIEFEEYYKLPYLVNRWKNDFNINGNYNFILDSFVSHITTHCKILLKRN